MPTDQNVFSCTYLCCCVDYNRDCLDTYRPSYNGKNPHLLVTTGSEFTVNYLSILAWFTHKQRSQRTMDAMY